MGRLTDWFINRLPMPDTGAIVAQVLQEIKEHEMILLAANDAIQENLYEIASELDTYDIADNIRDEIMDEITYNIDMCEVAENIDLDNLAGCLDLETAIGDKVTSHLEEVDFSDHIDTDDIKSSVSDDIIDDVISELASRLED